MKKVLSFILVLSMVLGSFGMAFAAPVATSDIAGHKNEAAIQRLNKLGIVEGDDRGFAPDANITRAEFAVMLVRALGLEASANLAKGDTQFTDVTVAAGYEWATGAINVANRLGYINGYGDGKFGPADSIRYEDAITMIVRALGYEPAAQAKGGYPVGYLVVAEQDLDLTDNTTVAAGTAATRGTVFQMLDNSLTESMMVQVGYGDKAEYEIDDTKTLLGQLGYTTLANHRMVDFDADDLEITVRNENVKPSHADYLDAVTLEVEEDFDFEANFGLKLTVWYDKDEVVVAAEAKDEALFDAMEVTVDEEEIKLIDANKKYDVNADAVVFIDGTEEAVTDLLDGDTYNYAKVVLNNKNEVMFVNAYDLDELIVVEEVEENVVYGYGDEVNVKDYTIVKEGKTIAIEDLEAGDILFFNMTEKYAEVFNNSVEGEIEDIFDGSFTVDGEDYDIEATSLYFDVETEDLDTLTETELEAMQEEGEDVQVFLSRDGLVVLVTGVRGEAVTTTISGILTANLAKYTSRNTAYYAIDMVNNAGEKVSYDVKVSSVTVTGTTVSADVVANEGAVVELKVDEDGDVEEIKTLTPVTETENVELDDKYIGSNRFKSTTVVYFLEGENHTVADIKANDVVVTTWADVEAFEKLTEAVVYANGGYVKYLVVAEDNTDSVSELEELTALVTDVRYNTDDELVRLTAFVDGTKTTYTVAEVVYAEDLGGTKDTVLRNIAADDVVILKVDEDGVVKTIVKDSSLFAVQDVQLTKVVTRDSEITVLGGTEYKLVSDGNVYDITGTTKAVNLRDLRGTTVVGEDYDTVTVVFDGSSTTLVKMIIVTGEGTN